MKIITLLNESGGVGKTTLATHIAAGLAIRGQRVALVDADAQGTATLALGQPYEPGFYDLLVRRAKFSSVLRNIDPAFYAPEGVTPDGQLFLLPSNAETRYIGEAISDTYLVRDRFMELEDAIDVVIFDTSPTPSLLHGSIYMATDGIIYPTKCEFFSMGGLSNSLIHRGMAQSKREGTPIKVLGIIPTMYRAKTAAHLMGLRELRKQFGAAVWTALPLRTVWVEAALMQQTVYAYDNTSDAAADAWEIVERVEEAVTAWVG